MATKILRVFQEFTSEGYVPMPPAGNIDYGVTIAGTFPSTTPATFQTDITDIEVEVTEVTDFYVWIRSHGSEWNYQYTRNVRVYPDSPDINNVVMGIIIANLDNTVPYTGATENVDLGEFGIKAGHVGFDLTPTDVPTAEGTLSWNDGDGTLDLILKGGNVTLQVGQELVARCYNAEATTLVDGEIVYIYGSQGNRVSVKRASASSEMSSSVTFGMVTESIASGAEGFVTISGVVNKLNTSGLTAGTALWLGTTPGTYTPTKPTAPIHSVLIGYVERVHATVGAIYVKIQNGYELDELHNVKITSVAENDFLIYDATNSVWENRAILKTNGYLPYFDSTEIFKQSPIFTDGTNVTIDSLDVITGGGTANYIPKLGTTKTLVNSLLYDNGTNVGIGSTNPQFKFEVRGGAMGVYASTSYYGKQEISNNDYMFTSGSGFYFRTNDATATVFAGRINNSGNWGIGILNPTQKLDVNGNINIPTGSNYLINGSQLNTDNIPQGSTNQYLTEAGLYPYMYNFASGEIKWNVVTHQFYMNQASSTTNGWLSNTDWNTFNNKENAITAGTTAQYWRGDKSWQTLNTSVVPEGTNLYYTDARSRSAISSSATGLTYTSGTGVFSLTAGYAIPTTSALGNYDTAYNRSLTAVAVSGTTTKTITLTKQDGTTLTASWSDLNTDAVTSVFGRTGAIVATSGDYTTSQVTESGNLYYTDARARASVSAGTGISYNLTTGVISYSGTVYTDSSIRALFSAGSGISYNNTTGVIASTITQYTDAMARASLSFTAGSGAYNSTTGVITIPTNTSQLTNGANFITLASLSASSPLSYNNTTGAFSIAQASGSTNGFLSSTDWNTFNNKQNALGYTPVPTTRTLTINGTSYDLSADRTWTIAGTISGLTTNYIPKATGATTLGNSVIYDNGSAIGIATTSLTARLTIDNAVNVNTNAIDILGNSSQAKAHIGQFANNLYLSSNYYYSGGQNYDNASLGQAVVIISAGITNTSYIDFNLSDAGSTLPTNKVRINASGNMSIGNTNNTYKLDVSGDGRFTNALTASVLNSSNGTINLNAEYLSGYDATIHFKQGGYHDWYIKTPAGNNPMQFIVDSTTLMTLNSSGNLGLGITPSAWRNIFTALQVGYTGTLYAISTSTASEQVNLASNYYQDSAGNELRIQAGYATRYQQASGEHRWSTAGTSTAGSGISFTQAMTLDASGRLAVGNTSPNARISASSSGRIIEAIYTAASNGNALRIDQQYAGGSNFTDFSLIYVINKGSNPYITFNNGTSDIFSIANSGSATFSSSVTAGGNIASSRAIVAQGANDSWTGAGAFLDIVGGSYGRLGVYNYSTSAWMPLNINNSSIYSAGSGGNVGIGTTSPSNGLLVINSTASNGVRFALESSGTMNGIVALGSNAISGLSTTDMALWTRGVMAFETGASGEKMRITSSGNVGIGTKSPVSIGSYRTLTIQGGSTTNGGLIQLQNSDSTSQAYWFTTNNSSILKTVTNHPLIFGANNTDYVYVTSGGNVGIATSSPQSALHIGSGNFILGANPSTQYKFNVQGISGNYISFWTPTFSGADQNGIISHNGSGLSGLRPLGFTGTEFVFGNTVTGGGLVQVNGDVNISGTFRVNGTAIGTGGGGVSGSGTTNIHAKWSGSTSLTNAIVEDDGSANVYINGASVANASALNFRIGGSNKGLIAFVGNDMSISNLSSSPITFLTNNSEKMRLASDGRLMINQTSASAGNAYLQITQGTSLDPAVTIKSGGYIFQFTNSSNGVVGTITHNGTNTAYNTSSDYRLKTDLRSFNGLQLLDKINVYDFAWKVDNSRMFGVMAHELQEVLPYAVTGIKDGNGMQGVDYSKIVPILVQSIKELKAEIATLKDNV